ncbi:MAG: hypothetical protein A2637_00230 [Candidatus Muproteobacteria bacterium RIFCSPHIGHO2_01_FULL_65_16]|uniref:General secretion pathway GspH domain-containing protein n=1 Tax=Candidatus Muproteobacteria bacterium RIFCSPHIGHO2_01_FULL_65_16 TaxID=1817764 RepID=A0A1F6TPY7_9PROT|nr:MAG: hypothetical protein A2637_00230 [Candidatus Muproteobacteria bacterium RIFCSPHIGHO2_01_FULL_65_16]
MSNFINSNRLTTTTNDLVADLNLARSEAVKRAGNVVVCKSDDGADCTGTGTWASGRVVFFDADSSNTKTAGDTVLRVHEAMASGNTVTASASDVIVYSKQGAITAGSGDYTICNSNMKRSRTIGISATGRASLTQGAC